MSDFGTITDWETGEPVRPATPAEWRQYAEALNRGYLQRPEFRVHGGPDNKVYSEDIRALRDEAASAGDLEMASLCDQALNFTGTGDSRAFDECTKVILDTRMRVAADTTEGEQK